MQEYLQFGLNWAKLSWEGQPAMQVDMFLYSICRLCLRCKHLHPAENVTALHVCWERKRRYRSVCSCSSEGQKHAKTGPTSATVTSVLTSTVVSANKHWRGVWHHVIRTGLSRTLPSSFAFEPHQTQPWVFALLMPKVQKNVTVINPEESTWPKRGL